MQSLKDGLRHLHRHDPFESRVLSAGLESLICGRTVLSEFPRRHLTISEKILYYLDRGHKELIQWVVRAECLHADDLATDLTIELETHCHFAAFGQWAVLTKKNHIENFLNGIVSDPESQRLLFQLWPMLDHEISYDSSLVVCCYVKITKALIISSWQVKVKVHESENVFRWSTHDVIGLLHRI